MEKGQGKGRHVRASVRVDEEKGDANSGESKFEKKTTSKKTI